MKDWVRRTTAELIGEGVLEIGDGYRAKNAEFAPGGGLPFVRVGDVGASTLRVDGIDELPRAEQAKYEPKVSRPGDSLITMKGTVGRVALVPDDLRPFVYSPQISYWRSHDREVIHPRWLRYWLESPEFTGQASATKGATDMADYINLRDQRRMQISLPALGMQERIAQVLGSVDDLIDNNRRRAETLEEMARAIYREWFIRFRYPGHLAVPLVDSPLGPIPAGWTAGRWGDAAVLDYGKALRDYKDSTEGFPVFGTNGPIGWHHTSLFPLGVVVGRKGAYRGVHYTSQPCWVIDTAFFLRIRDTARLDPLYAFHQLRTVDLNSIDSGSAIPSTTRPAFYAIPLVIPSIEPMRRFAEVAGGIRAEQEALGKASEVLRRIRGLLLPKLVSGQIDVSHLDLDALAEATTA